MDNKRISILSGTALLALTATASAGPMSVTSSQIITPPIQIEQAHYFYRHHYSTMAGTVAGMAVTGAVPTSSSVARPTVTAAATCGDWSRPPGDRAGA